MHARTWPDPLSPPTGPAIQSWLDDFWATLAPLGDILNDGQYLLAADTLHRLRSQVLNLMLALNGIVRPADTRHLNTYLGESQRRALEKTLALPAAGPEAFIAQAVALVVIYRWYAPQLAAKYGVTPPADQEVAVLDALAAALPDWPRAITTE